MSNETWCTYVRLLAMIMVIALHSLGPWLLNTPIASGEWSAANALDSLSRPSVPLFFMLSGYLLSKGGPLPWVTYFRMRIMRIGPAFLVTTAFAVAYRARHGEQFDSAILWQWLVSPQFYHLWFFYALAFVYVALWVVKPSPISPLSGALCCLGLTILAGGGLAHFTTGYLIRYEEFLVYFFYALGGHYVANIRLSKRAAALCFAATVGFVAAIFLLTRGVSLAAGQLDQQYYGYGSVAVVCASFSLFYGLRNLFEGWHAPPTINVLSASSLAIYCGHPFIIDTVMRRVPDLMQRFSVGWGITMLIIASIVVMTMLSQSTRFALRNAVKLYRVISGSREDGHPKPLWFGAFKRPARAGRCVSPS